MNKYLRSDYNVLINSKRLLAIVVGTHDAIFLFTLDVVDVVAVNILRVEFLKL